MESAGNQTEKQDSSHEERTMFRPEHSGLSPERSGLSSTSSERSGFSPTSSERSGFSPTNPNKKGDIGKAAAREKQEKQEADELLREIETMPMCSERILIHLHYKLTCILNKEGNLQELEENICQELTLLEDWSKKEDLRAIRAEFSKSIRNSVSSLKDFRGAKDEVRGALRKIRPLNIFLLQRYIDEAKTARKSLAEKDIYLLYGPTGAGKSTTIHFFAGSKFDNIQGHLNPIADDPKLKDITTSSDPSSETRFVRPISISLESYGLPSTCGKSIIICDTPGIQDTNGPEVDISNSVGIFEAVQDCNSVKILLLISKMSIGDRMTGFSDMTHHLVGLINNIDDTKKAFSYIFTKFSEEDDIPKKIDDFHRFLQEKKTDDDPEQLKLVSDMAEKAEDDQLIKINPLKDNPGDILKKLFKITKKSIKTPKDVFRISLSQKSQNVLGEQIRAIKQSIMTACKLKEYKLAIYRLEQLKILTDLKQKSVDDCYQESIKEIFQSLEEAYTSSVSNFKIFQLNSPESLQSLKRNLEASNNAEGLKKHDITDFSASGNIKSSDSYMAYLEDEINSLLRKLEEENFSEQVKLIENGMQNVRLLSENFKGFEKKLEEARIKLEAQVKNITTRFRWLVSNERLQEAANYASNSHEFTLVAAQILGIETNSIRDDQKKAVLDAFQRPLEDIIELLKGDSLKRDDINLIKKFLDQLKRVKTIFFHHALLISEEIKVLRDRLMKEIEDLFNHYANCIEGLFSVKEDPKPLEAIQRRFDEMMLLKEIPNVESRTSQQFKRAQGKINQFVKDIRSNIDRNISKLRTSEKYDADELRVNLINLKQCAWIENCCKGIYSNVLGELTTIVNRQFDSIENELFELDFGFENPENIPKATAKVAKIVSLKELKELLPDVADKVTSLDDWFKTQIREGFDHINKSFDLDKLKNVKEGGNLTWSIGLYRKSQEYLQHTLKPFRKDEKRKQCQDNLNEYAEKYLEYLENSTSEAITGVFDGKFEGIKGYRKLKLAVKNIEEMKNMKANEVSYCDDALYRIKRQVSDFEADFEGILKLKDKSGSKIAQNAELFKLFDEILDTSFSKLVSLAETNAQDADQKLKASISEMLKKDSFRQVQNQLKDFKDFPDLIKTEIGQFTLDKVYKMINLVDSPPKEEIEIERIAQILSYIRSIKEIQKCLGPYLNDISDEIIFRIEKATNGINQLISRYIKSAENLQKSFKFKEVEEKRSQFRTFNDKCEGIIQEIVNSCEDLKDKFFLNQINEYEVNYQRFLHGLAEKFKKIEDFKFNFHICEELEKVKDLNVIYKNVLAEIQKTIQISFGSALLTEETSQVRESIEYLPKSLANNLEKQVTNLENNIVQLEKDFKNAKDQEKIDIDNLKDIFSHCPNEAKRRNWEDDIAARMEGSKKIIEDASEAQTFTSAIDILGENFKLKDLGKQRNLKKVYEACKSELEKNFKESVKQSQEILNSLSEKSEIKITENESTQILKEMKAFGEVKNHLGKINKDLKNDLSGVEKSLESVTSKVKGVLLERCERSKKLLDEKQHAKFALIVKEVKILNLICSQVKDNLIDGVELKPFEEINQSVQNRFTEYEDSLLTFDIINHGCSKRVLEEKYSEFSLLLEQMEKASKIREDFDFKSIQEKLENKVNQTKVDLTNILSESLQRPQEKAEGIKVDLHYNNLKAFLTNVKFGFTIKIEDVEDTILEKVDNFMNQVRSAKKEEEIDVACKGLAQTKYLSEWYSFMRDKIDDRIDSFLEQYKKNSKSANSYSKLGAQLLKDHAWIGSRITEDHKCFEGLNLSIFNERTKKYDIKYVLDRLNGDKLEKSKLMTRFKTTIETYDKTVKQYLNSKKIEYDKLVSTIQGLIGSPKKEEAKGINWNDDDKSNLPNIIAHIFAIWTLQHSKAYFEINDPQNKDNYLRKPHPAQILAIFRILGVGNTKEILENNAVEVLTGEGKSLILAVAATVFALYGFDVYCTCYSEYLCERDYNSFQSLFAYLGVNKNIRYGIFPKLCEDIINEGGDLREFVRDLILSRERASSKKIKSSERPKVLLFDEVDVFFTPDFYGNLYNISTSLHDKTIFELISSIWNKKDEKPLLPEIKNSQEYQACLTQFKNWQFLIENAVLDMVSDIKEIDNELYFVLDDKIKYKEQDNMVSNVRRGYKTLFCYLKEYHRNKISRNALESNSFLNIRSGTFSYAEIPKNFTYIMGVTGTLGSLSDVQQKIIKEEYKIAQFTYLPSVYGQSNNNFLGIQIEKDESDYFKRIRGTILDKLNDKNRDTKRSVIVFFASTKLLDKFRSEEFDDFPKSDMQILKEELEPKEKESIIRRAGLKGQVTLAAKCFSRGTDFICNDPEVKQNGGIHVIQTFVAENIAEEIQVKGRTARQGDYGTYNWILLRTDLEQIGIKDDDLVDQSSAKLHEIITKKSKQKFEEEYKENVRFNVDFQKTEHQESIKFSRNLAKGQENLDSIKEYLEKKNQGTADECNTNTLVLMDATGSMSQLLLKTKHTVGEMFERILKILTEKKVDKDSFLLQFAVYRNYNSKNEKILQNSGWQSSAQNLRDFMSQIEVEGGWGNEAIEIGLWHANQLLKRGYDLSQILLIGDAPPNTPDEVRQKRECGLGENYWQSTRLSVMTTTEQEIEKLKDKQNKQIPIHAFYVDKRAKNAFEGIASCTGGNSDFLDINSSKGAKVLTDCLAIRILSAIEKAKDRGSELTDLYMKQYV